jgi:NhaP-type Na+/H+ or K+/H+ antiporter
MAPTVALIAVLGVPGLRLPLGATILPGAILVPTDPMIASAVQRGCAIRRAGHIAQFEDSGVFARGKALIARPDTNT